MNMPYTAVVVSINDSLKKHWKKNNEHSLFTYMGCGLIAGASAAFFNTSVGRYKNKNTNLKNPL